MTSPRVGVDTAGHPTTVTHECPPAAWDAKPEAHQEDVPRHEPTRRKCFYAAFRAAFQTFSLLGGWRSLRHVQALNGLAGDLSDYLKVLVEVQDREPGQLRRRRDDQVRY